MRREDIEFHSGGNTCAAWLYRPESEGPHPIVVLAHGFAGVREARLWAYAERFAAAGMGALRALCGAVRGGGDGRARVRLQALRRERRKAAPAARHRAPARRLARRD